MPATDLVWLRSCKKLWALSISFSLFLWKRFSATPVIRWHAYELLWNLNRKQGNLAIKYFKSKPWFKKGINFFRGAKRMKILRFWDARRRFTMLEWLFTGLNDQKIAWRWIEIFGKWTHCKNYFKLSFQAWFVFRLKFGNRTIVNPKANCVAWKVICPYLSELSITSII